MAFLKQTPINKRWSWEELILEHLVPKALHGIKCHGKNNYISILSHGIH
jgi:hypothetical protein